MTQWPSTRAACIALRRIATPAFLATPALLAAMTMAVVPKEALARQLSSQPIEVVSLGGEVAVTMRGTPRDVAPGTLVELPSVITTGPIGRLRLRQGATALAMAGNTEVEIPASAAAGNLMEHIVQRRGNVFYDVQHREVGRFHVETPYLVAVVKGTQFNVAVQDGTTTVSLFEGRLEIRTPDGSHVVQLDAGEIAIRSADDPRINVLRVGQQEEVVGTDPEPAPPPLDGLSVSADPALDAPVAAIDGLTAASYEDALPEGDVLELSLHHADDALLGGHLELGSLVDDINLHGAITAPDDLALDAGVELGDLGADLGLEAGVDLGEATADLGLDVAAELGDVGADLGLEADVDLADGSADLGLDAELDLGDAGADVGLDGNVDLGEASADLGVGADLDLGDAAAELDLDVGMDLDDGAVELDAEVELGDAGVELGLDGDLDGNAGIDAGVELGDVELDAGVDINLGGDGDLLEVDLNLDLGGGGSLLRR